MGFYTTLWPDETMTPTLFYIFFLTYLLSTTAFVVRRTGTVQKTRQAQQQRSSSSFVGQQRGAAQRRLESSSSDTVVNTPSSQLYKGNVTVIDQNEHYLVISKPHAVVCHHSEWTGSRSNQEIPMLQRVRQAVGKRVNLVHRLDRGCTGCLLMTYADSENATSALIDSMAGDKNKTYLALVRGEGIVGDREFHQEGWFKVDRPLKNDAGDEKEAVTWFRFIAGQDNGMGTLDRPRASLVLARPENGRFHQIRRHLFALSHPILGDSTHGNAKENRMWKKRGMLPERTCLHLMQLQLEPTLVSPNGINVTAPLAPDMMRMLKDHLPDVLERALPILREEGIELDPQGDFVTLPFEIAV